MPDDIDFLVHFSRTLCISLPRASATVEAVKQQLQTREGVPAALLELYANGEKLVDDALVPRLPVLVRARLRGGLRGGKGGFGAMLRSSGKGAGAKATTSFGACRDLNGRRLRHVNQEVAVQKWRDDSDTREQRRVLGVTDQEILDDETPSGIPGWYLATPSWAESVKTSHVKRRRNTMLCKHWLQARAPDRAPPPRNAPRWWGCPRGRDCDYAHGESELRGAALTEFKRAKRNDAAQTTQQALATYVAYEHEDDVAAALQDGLRKRRAERKRTTAAPVKAASPSSTSASPTAFSDPPIDAVAANWLVPLNTNANADDADAVVRLTFAHGLCELRGASNFGSVVVPVNKLRRGKWYYEVRLVTAGRGVVQLGWVDQSAFTADSTAGDGVGDHAQSWAFDTRRALKWTAGRDAPFGSTVARDDVIGCLLDADAQTLAFSVNGTSLGVAFDAVACLVGGDGTDETAVETPSGFTPAISLDASEIVLVNIGAQPLLYKPSGFASVFDALVGAAASSDALHASVQRSNAPGKVEKEGPVAVTNDVAVAPHVPIDLDAITSQAQLEQLGLAVLKNELQWRGLKCGGSLSERAARLWSVRGKHWDAIETKLKDPRASAIARK